MNYQKFKAELLKDKEIRQEYGKLQPKYDLIAGYLSMAKTHAKYSRITFKAVSEVANKL